MASTIVITILILTIWKQGVFELGLTGSSGGFMPLLHHSRWGAGIALIGSLMLFYKKQETIALFLIVIGLVLIMQHLATEQCFSILQSLFTPDGKPVGGFC